jgi:Methylase involved in ubiquinone/menaquinone biosynthesis
LAADGGDVGGGGGWFTAAFRARGAHCYLFEPDPAELSFRTAAPVGGVVADGYWLPVRDGTADVVFSSNVLEHVPDPMGLIEEMIRATRPGGLVYLSYTNWYSPWGGHEMSPWHYLGPRYAGRRYIKRYQRKPKHEVGANLFRVHVGPVLRALRARPDVEIVAARPRYYPRWCRLLLRLPGLREDRYLEPHADHETRRMTIRVGAERLARLAIPTGEVERDRTSGKRPRGPVLRWAGLVWLVAFLVLLANDPGRMFFETKLSVDLDPAGFYASLWHLMDPRNTFGALNNQAIGYAAPMGPFYLAGQLAHVPVWLTERLWLSLIIAVGFAGLVKLAEALDIGSPASACWPAWYSPCGRRSPS